MKRKVSFVLAIALCLSIVSSACSRNEPADSPLPNNHSQNDTNTPLAEVSPSTAKKIVFHDTIDDPQEDYLNSLSGGVSETSGTANLDLILSETEPDVFEGYGIIHRSVHISQADAGGSTQEYIYRTGLIHADAGKETSVNLTGWLTYDNQIPAMVQDAPFNVVMHKDATLRQEGLPLLLTLNGSEASLSIKLHDHAEFIFRGEQTSDPAEPPVGRPSDPDSLLYVNSMWSCEFSGETDGGEYTAVLLASPKSGTYSGQLTVQGTGDALDAVSEAVTFSFTPYDAAEYRQAGGRMDDSFASMSVLYTAGGTYILLLDGEQVMLEPAGKAMYFCGSTRAQVELESLQNEATKTQTMLNYLCREKTGMEGEIPDYSGLQDLDPNNPEDMQKLIDMSAEMNAMFSHQGSPAWYPDDLIPMVNFSVDDGFVTLPSEKEMLFIIYNTQYAEEEDFADLVEPYRAVLSGYDDYKEYLDYDTAEGVFLFTMGKYTVQVYMGQDALKLTGIGVQIY